MLVAFASGLLGKEDTWENFAAMFDENPRAVALVEGCRRDRGPFVQAGVVSFMEEAKQHFRFRLLGDLGPGFASSNLGVVCPQTEADEIEKVLEELGGAFSEKLDPLRLLVRVEELVETASRLEQHLNRANTRANRAAPQLKKKNEELGENNTRLKKSN